MPKAFSSFYESEAIQSLFARELGALTPILSGIYGNAGLFLRADSRTRSQLPAHLLGGMIDLAFNGEQLEGALRCDPEQLPFASGSFNLLIAQHLFERCDRTDECAAEIARVLAPEGVALIFGFNPVGSWRPWLALNSPRGSARLRLQSAQAWRKLLEYEQVDTLQVRFPGTFWPHSTSPYSLGIGNETSDARWYKKMLRRFSSSWLLLARKRRSTLTPLRLRSGARELAINPRLAPGAHRTHA